MQITARRLALSLLATLAAPVAAQTRAAPAKPVQVKSSATATPWLYRGSDIPPDAAWVFGELPNGLRYAVRRNGAPPRQISIRVAIDAGSMHERASEKGYAHFNEHLSFRGSRYIADGEAKRLWQRLGATFGSDTNASTTPTQTVYRLDLPSATADGLDESVKVLSGMMAGATITATAVDTERRTVMAELRESDGAARRAGDAARETFFAGQALGSHAPIGDVPSLNGATVASLKGFRDRWYRPERATVVIVGDGDPAIFRALIEKYFAAWQGVGASPADPDFGRPDPRAPRVRVVEAAGVPLSMNLAVLRPWVPKADTVEYNRGKLVDTLALRILSRRLETRARAGGSFLQASANQDDVARSVDGTFVSILPLGDDWAAALRDVRGVIADALTRAPSQAEIDREKGEFTALLQQQVDQASVETSADLSDLLVGAVDIRETVASPQVAFDVFTQMGGRLTPANLLASARRMFTGAPMRAVLTTPTPLPGAAARLLAALDARVTASAQATSAAPVDWSRLPRLGAPATVVGQQAVNDAGLTFVQLSNGVRLSLLSQPEAGRVFVTVRFGRGYQALPADRPSDAWAAGAALMAGGIGDLGQDALDRLVSGRQIQLNFGIADDAFTLSSVTTAADVPDQLRLMAAKLAAPRWDAAPVLRAKAGVATGLATLGASPTGVLNRDLPGLLRGGDPRFASPTAAQVAATTPASFRALWEPLLASGPIEVAIFGDMPLERMIAAASATFGALPARTAAVVDPSRASSPSVAATATPIVRTHSGSADQAAAVVGWPTAGGPDAIFESRKLDVLAEIFEDRLFDRFREAEGASYSPSASSSWPTAMPGGGSLVATALLKPEGVDAFFTLAATLARELATTPVSDDDLKRAVGPMREQIARASSSNGFWLRQLTGATYDVRRLQNLATLTSDYARITPADVQAAAARWLKPETMFRMKVLPEPK